MENSDFSTSCKPSEHAQMAIECAPRYNPLGVLYVSPNISAATSGQPNSDIRFQNLALFQIASVGVPASTATDLGEIWVHYKIKLMKPQLGGSLTSLISGHYINPLANGAATGGAPFGVVTATNQPQVATGTLLPLAFTSNSFSFPLAVTEGNYLCSYVVEGNAATIAGVGVACAAGAILQVWSNATTPDAQLVAQGPQNAATGIVSLSVNFLVQVNAPGSALCTVTLTSASPPTAGRWDLFVTPINSNIIS